MLAPPLPYKVFAGDTRPCAGGRAALCLWRLRRMLAALTRSRVLQWCRLAQSCDGALYTFAESHIIPSSPSFSRACGLTPTGHVIAPRPTSGLRQVHRDGEGAAAARGHGAAGAAQRRVLGQLVSYSLGCELTPPLALVQPFQALSFLLTRNPPDRLPSTPSCLSADGTESAVDAKALHDPTHVHHADFQ